MEEGIVQITNPKGAVKAVVVRITDWSLVQVQPGPPNWKLEPRCGSFYFLSYNISMKWTMPPTIKVYEALGAIGDDRIKVDGDSAKLYSSSRGKYYTISYNPETRQIYANDNASFFAGYLGYPAIALLFAKGILSYHNETAEALAGIAWKDINQKNKNDFEKTIVEVNMILEAKGLHPQTVSLEVSEIMRQLAALDLQKPDKKTKPPKGY